MRNNLCSHTDILLVWDLAWQKERWINERCKTLHILLLLFPFCPKEVYIGLEVNLSFLDSVFNSMLWDSHSLPVWAMRHQVSSNRYRRTTKPEVCPIMSIFQNTYESLCSVKIKLQSSQKKHETWMTQSMKNIHTMFAIEDDHFKKYKQIKDFSFLVRLYQWKQWFIFGWNKILYCLFILHIALDGLILKVVERKLPARPRIEWM